MSKKEPLSNIILAGNGEAPNECWLWANSRDSGGYGRVQHNGRLTGTHRLSFETHVGQIPEGMVINHKCGTKACWNPQHLEAVSQKQNTEYRTGQEARNTSGFRGVSYYKRINKWLAKVQHNGKQIHCGYYDTPEAAAAAAHAKRVELGFHEATATVPNPRRLKPHR